MSCIGNAPTAGLLGTQGAMQAMDKVPTAWNWASTCDLIFTGFQTFFDEIWIILCNQYWLVMRDVQTIKDQAIQFWKWVIYLKRWSIK